MQFGGQARAFQTSLNITRTYFLTLLLKWLPQWINIQVCCNKEIWTDQWIHETKQIYSTLTRLQWFGSHWSGGVVKTGERQSSSWSWTKWRTAQIHSKVCNRWNTCWGLHSRIVGGGVRCRQMKTDMVAKFEVGHLCCYCTTVLTVQILYCKNALRLWGTQRISREAAFVGNSLQNNNKTLMKRWSNS